MIRESDVQIVPLNRTAVAKSQDNALKNNNQTLFLNQISQFKQTQRKKSITLQFHQRAQ
ncbi:unnamed protein product [Paramecium octaurelia]|uniref:Uncharacterized protein n=1 Tax=Paramecium octaurelia TaxID=43137 RepID=A0A8S1YNU1_PAROT|nr:unnamed protein product [Paramecium octaurelia]